MLKGSAATQLNFNQSTPVAPMAVSDSICCHQDNADTYHIGELIRRELARCHFQSRLHTYSANSPVFSQGIKADALYFIEEGIIKVTRGEANGSLLIVGLRGRGQIIGLPSVLLAQPYTTSAIALTRSVVQEASASEFMAAIRANSQLAWQALQFQSRKVCERLERIVWFGSLSARDRLMHFLSELVSTREPKERSGDIKIPATLKFWEIAQAIGVTPPYLTRLFNGLEKEGVIRRDKGWVILTWPPKAAVARKTPFHHPVESPV